MKKLSVPCKYELLRVAKKRLSISSKDYYDIHQFLDSSSEYAVLSGRRVAVVVSAVVYLYCRHTGKDRFTQKNISDVLGVSEVSLRNTSRIVFPLMPEDRRKLFSDNVNLNSYFFPLVST